jgi:2-oxoglutarate dehydrogenase E2 component (dihydrolipoamide succinyltransferase)
MSEEFKVTLPKLGESILNATIVQWFKKEGESVALDEPLLEVSTDKVNSEIPSPVSGVVKTILAPPDTELQVGDALVIITVGGVAEVKNAAAPLKVETVQTSSSSEMKDFFSPALLRLAREKGIELKELEKITGTGEGGRITKKDLELYAEKRCAAPAPCPLKTISTAAGTERVKMSGLRKAIAENMVRSFYEAPHATLVHEVDVTEILALIQREKEAFSTKHGAKLTITSFVARALSRALKEYPLLNSSLEEDTIVLKHFVNLGIAVSVEQGVVVPVIKNCHELDLSSIAKAIGDLSLKARSGKLTQPDVADGTISMTNFGISGVEIGIPIIRYPEVAIVGIGAAQKKAVVGPQDQIVVRTMMHICLTFDHRVLDGMYGCAFLGALKSHLEKDINL